MIASIVQKRDSIGINTVINYTAMVYALLLPVSRAGVSVFTVLLFLLWLFEGSFKDKFTFLTKNRVIITISALFVFSALSILWSMDHAVGLDRLRKFFYLLPIIVFATSIRKEFLFRILSAFLFGMLISEILSYGIFFEWWNFKDVPPDNPTPFMHHIQYSMFLAVSSLLLLNSYFFATSVKWKYVYFIYFLAITSNLFLNGGRTGQLAFAITIFVVGFINMKNKFLAFLSMLVLLIMIFYTAYNLSPVFKTRFDQASHEVTKISKDTKDQYAGSFGMRMAVWEEAGKIVPENLLIGVGIGDGMRVLQTAIDEYKYDKYYNNALKFMTEYHYHNMYVQVLVELGIIGLLLYLLVFYPTLKLQINDKELSNFRYIFVTVYSVSSLVEPMFILQFPLALFALFIGLFIGFSHINEDEFKVLAKNKKRV